MHRALANPVHLLSLLLCVSGLPVSAEVYQWTDAEGGVHFGDRPPREGARSVPVPETPSTPAPTPAERLEKQRNLLRAFEEERRLARDAREQTQRDQLERKRNCNQARDRLQAYERSSGIYDLDAAGERVYLDAAQRDRFIAECRKDVEQWCGKP